MGKHDSGYTKIAKDFYATPFGVTQAILEAEMFNAGDLIYDPCAGEGHILDAAAELGINGIGTDLRDVGYPVHDFLQVRWAPDGADICTNPPYGSQGRLAVKFIEHALRLMKKRKGRVIMLLTNDFSYGKTRKHLFDHCEQFVRKYEVTDRIRWANLPQDGNGPKENHAWYVWSWQPRLPGGPKLKYLHGTMSK